MKQCSKCKKIKPVIDFYKYKSGKNAKYKFYMSYCIICYKKWYKRIKKETPWVMIYKCIESRCNYGRYKERGIKNYLTSADLKTLWLRDKAHLLKKPSIDRIKAKKHYTIENCRFIELGDNIRRRYSQ